MYSYFVLKLFDFKVQEWRPVAGFKYWLCKTLYPNCCGLSANHSIGRENLFTDLAGIDLYTILLWAAGKEYSAFIHTSIRNAQLLGMDQDHSDL